MDVHRHPPNGGGALTTFHWEGEELRSTDTGDGMLVNDYESSDAPAQGMLNILDYHDDFWEQFQR